MAKCYLGKLLYGKMLLRLVVIWRNVIWRDVIEPIFFLTSLESNSYNLKIINNTEIEKERVELLQVNYKLKEEFEEIAVDNKLMCSFISI